MKIWLQALVAIVVVADLWLIYDLTARTSCSAVAYRERVALARDYLIHHWTKSARPNDPTALPDGTTGPELLELETGPIDGGAFYTEASGGIAFFAVFDDRCGMHIKAERCPGRACALLR